MGWYYWGGKEVMKRWDLSLDKTATERYNYEYVEADCSVERHFLFLMPIHYRPRVFFWNFSDEFQIVLNEQQHISQTAGQLTGIFLLQAYCSVVYRECNLIRSRISVMRHRSGRMNFGLKSLKVFCIGIIVGNCKTDCTSIITCLRVAVAYWTIVGACL